MKNKYDFIVIGGGAAGFFAALSAANHYENLKVCIIEKSSKLLSKVKVSGGGRCNVTHSCFNNSELIQNYPRGGKELKPAFDQFSVKETIEWFLLRGVKLKTENDGRMFPTTDNSQTIIDCLLNECQRSKIEIKTNTSVSEIQAKGDLFVLILANGEQFVSKKVLVATGGSPKEEGYKWLENFGHKIEKPVPSLFTFNVPDSDISELQGISMPNAKVKVLSTKLEQSGPILITHWGFSGPAVLKLSAWGARILNNLNYKFKIHINWLGDVNDEELKNRLDVILQENKKKIIYVNPLFNISKRLWQNFVQKAGIEEERRWIDISKKQLNKLSESILRSEYQVSGKTTFKEEFVTCGGIKLSEINFKTMESKKVPGVFFAGEVLDVDGVTGGFNFQNAWTTGWIAGKNVNC